MADIDPTVVLLASVGFLGGTMIFFLREMDKKERTQKDFIDPLRAAVAGELSIQGPKPHDFNTNHGLRSADQAINKNVMYTSKERHNPKKFVNNLIMQKMVSDQLSSVVNFADTQQSGYRIPSRSEMTQYDPYER